VQPPGWLGSFMRETLQDHHTLVEPIMVDVKKLGFLKRTEINDLCRLFVDFGTSTKKYTEQYIAGHTSGDAVAGSEAAGELLMGAEDARVHDGAAGPLCHFPLPCPFRTFGQNPTDWLL